MAGVSWKSLWKVGVVADGSFYLVTFSVFTIMWGHYLWNTTYLPKTTQNLEKTLQTFAPSTIKTFIGRIAGVEPKDTSPGGVPTSGKWLKY